MTPEDMSSKMKTISDKLAVWVNGSIGDIAHELIPFIQQRYLSGQALNRITGRTSDSVKAWYSKKRRSWFVRPGIGIPGNLNYLAQWAGTEHEFMKPGLAAYLAVHDVKNRMLKDIDRRIENVMQKQG